MNEPITVFILAAGLGERLLPVTSYIPKPLIPIVGKPVLQSVLERVSGIPVGGIGVNLHHKGDMVRDWINSTPFCEKVKLFPEEPILGTGGALKNAERFLSRRTFLVHNADILSSVDIKALIDFHRTSGNLATLAVHDFQRFNSVSIDSEGFLKEVRNSVIQESSVARRVAFTGIAVYEPEFLGFLPEGASSVVDAWMSAIDKGHKIATFDVTGCLWSDIGTPSAYAEAVIGKMRAEGETIFIHPSTRGCQNVEMNGYVVIEENSSIPENVSLKNCIVLPGAGMRENYNYENCIVGPDFEIPLAEGKMLSPLQSKYGYLIGTGGSDREYYRMREKEGSAVLMKFSGPDEDFHRHIAYTEFFGKYGVPVPALLKKDVKGKEAVFEDLDDLSLYSWLKCRRMTEDVEFIYRKVIDTAVAIHSKLTAHIPECPLLKERTFDYDHLRWETRYFMENYIVLVRNVKIENMSLLDEEFHGLAVKVDSFPKTVIHRDFQSQNIMFTKGGTPRVIDYQGARMGPPAYDIVSLLWDPYYRLDELSRERLMSYYIECMQRKDANFNGKDFRETILPCRLQRHMQALGAYGFLSSVKGKKYFLKYVEEGIGLLKEDVTIAGEEFPALFKLVDSL